MQEVADWVEDEEESGGGDKLPVAEGVGDAAVESNAGIASEK